MRLCTVDGCGKPLRARGYCVMHWARWRKYGTPELPTWSEICTVDGCNLPVRSRRAELCETHYYRKRRTGATSAPVQVTGQCLAAGCTADAGWSGGGPRTSQTGYCRMHYLRLKKHGDVNIDGRWEHHHRWSGDDATYKAVHFRVKAIRGRSSKYPCVDCGNQAAHWSYDHTDPNEEFEPGKGPYSTDIGRYVARCVSCHRRFDMAARRRAS